MARDSYVELDSGLIIRTDTPEHWSEGKLLTKAEGKRRDRQHAINQLRKTLKPGDTVYTVIRHVSASGMSRRIDVYAIKDNEPLYLSGYAATALQWPLKDSGGNRGIVVTGCGMDMGFHLVYSLSGILFREEQGQDGGYALKQRWL